MSAACLNIRVIVVFGLRLCVGGESIARAKRYRQANPIAPVR